MKALWDILRDNITAWWLNEVCDCPEATLVYANRKRREYEAEHRRRG